MFNINVNVERFEHARKEISSWNGLVKKVNSEVGIDSGTNDVFDFIEDWDGHLVIDHHDGIVVIGVKVGDKDVFISCCNNGKGGVEAISAIVNGEYFADKDVAGNYLKEVLESI